MVHSYFKKDILEKSNHLCHYGIVNMLKVVEAAKEEVQDFMEDP